MILSQLQKNVACLPLLLAFLSCSEDPNLLNSLDTKFTDTDIIVVEDTLDVVSGSSFLHRLPMNGLHNMLGRSNQHEARMALQFITLAERDTVEILSAQLQLRAVTWFGDSTGSLDLTFNAHKILRAWSPLSLTWDTITSSGFYEESVIRGSYSGVMIADTEFVVIDLDTSMVREWLRPSVYTNNGIALIPEKHSTVARGFTSFGTDSIQFLPTLTIIAQNLAGTVTDTTEYTLGNDTFSGNVDDAGSTPGRIFAQAGVVYRSRLVFDASPIPRGAIVNQADVLLWLDDEATMLSSFSGDTLTALHVSTNLDDSTTFEVEGALGRAGSSGATLFAARRATQLWVNGLNNGLILRASTLNEFATLDLFVFHGPDTESPQFRPRVRVLYSIEQRR